MAGENGWSELSLREAGVRLIDCVHKTPPAAEIGYPYVAIPQMKSGRVELDGVRRITSEHFAEWTQKALPQTNDVILSRRCNPGETAWVNPGLECALGQNLVLLRSDGTKVFPPFLRWLVRGRDWWNQVGSFINVGAVFDSLKCADIPNFQLPLPPVSEQKAIAEVLGALDAKIELNRRMNLALESLARALFKSWFVDFDPVRAKMDGREPLGLSPATAALFPDCFEHQNGSLIPAGWEIKLLDEIASFLNGLALQKYPPAGEGDLPVIKIAQLRSGNTAGADLANDEVPPEYVIGDGDILFSWSGSLVVRVWCGGSGALNQHLFKVTSDAYPKWFFHQWVLEHLRDFRAIAASKATTMGHIQRHHLNDAICLVPPQSLIKALDPVMNKLLERFVSNACESETLAALRDTLLPRLLSGELRVADAERFTKAVSSQPKMGDN